MAPRFKVPEDWVYRGEGNCNVVLALPKTRQILRIRKSNRIKSLLGWIFKWISDLLCWCYGNNVPEEESRDLTFYKTIMRPLIGTNYVGNAEQVLLSKRQVKILEKQLANQRPDLRKSKRLQYGRAALFEDYALLPDEFYPYSLQKDTFAIEIKPKQGWVPFSEQQFPKCLFCMKQYIKRQNGYTKILSSYCPLDLFSGEETRMVKALRALVENPQNNFKIFKNGFNLYGDPDSNPETFNSFLGQFFGTNLRNYEALANDFFGLLQKCLLSNFDGTLNDCKEPLFCEWNKQIRENSIQNKLPKGSVLERILSVQMLDVEGNQYYYKLLGENQFRDYDYVEKIYKKVINHKGACLKCAIMMLNSSNEEDLMLVPYLIAAIAKDCSLMVTFRKITEEKCEDYGLKNVVSSKYGHFIVHIGVFDLYPKPISTIWKNRQKIENMLELCTVKKKNE